MENMVVTFAHQSAGDGSQAFLAIDADQQQLWQSRLLSENWSVFDFFPVDPLLTQCVEKGPPHLDRMCAAVFGYGMENADCLRDDFPHKHSVPPKPAEEAAFEKLQIHAIPILYWDDEAGLIEVTHCRDFAAREIEWIHNAPFAMLLRGLELMGREVPSLIVNH